MAVKNYYPQLPEIPYKKTSIGMDKVVEYANTMNVYPTAVKRMAYCMFRNESANGSKGVNGNFAGIQADCGKWTGLQGAIATTVRVDSGRVLRRFICFEESEGFMRTFDFLCYKVKQRGMYIGALGVSDINGLVGIYLHKWVGRISSKPSKAEIINWENLYRGAIELIK